MEKYMHILYNIIYIYTYKVIEIYLTNDIVFCYTIYRKQEIAYS